MLNKAMFEKISVLVPTISDVENLLPRQMYLSDDQEAPTRAYLEANAQKSWALRNPILSSALSFGIAPSTAKRELANRALEKLFRSDKDLANRARLAYKDQAATDADRAKIPSQLASTTGTITGASNMLYTAMVLSDKLKSSGLLKTSGLTPGKIKSYISGASHRIGGKGPLIPSEALDYVYGGGDVTKMTGSVLQKMRAAMSSTQKLPKYTTHRN